MNDFEREKIADVQCAPAEPAQVKNKHEERDAFVKKAFVIPVKKLLNRLYQAIRKDHKTLEENQAALASNQERLRSTLEKICSEMRELLDHEQRLENRLQTSLEKSSRHISARYEELCRQLKQQMESLQDRITQVGVQESHFQKQMENLGDALKGQQEKLEGRIQDVMKRLRDAKTAADADVLESVGAMVQDDDRLLRDIDVHVARCPESCFAHEFAEETIKRLRGKRLERVALLQSHDVEIIDTAETFDPSLHQALGKVPRAGGESGQARVERIGLFQHSGEDRRVIQKALVSVFEDVEITFSENRR